MMARVFAVLLAACGTSEVPAGTVCESTSECEDGLTCLEFAERTATSCTVVGKSCSTTCASDADCASLGTHFKCFATCTTDKVCGKVAAP